MPDLITPTHAPTERVELPPASEFVKRNNEFIDFAELDALIHDLVEELDRFEHLRLARFTGLWRAEGGKKGGLIVLGDIAVATSREKLGVLTDLFLWVAVDHAALYELTWLQLEALTYSQLCRVTRNSETGAYGLIQPPVRAFVEELERYGPWTTTLKAAKVAMEQQMRLDLFNQADDLIQKMDRNLVAQQVARTAADAINEGALGPDVSATYNGEHPMDQYNRERDEAGEDEQ